MLLDRLITRFTVDNNTILIPFEEFDPDWDQQLLDAGFESHGEGGHIVVPIPGDYTPKIKKQIKSREKKGSKNL